MKKTFFAILLALVTFACSKNNDETAQKPASIDDVIGEWEAQVNEKTYKGTATLNLSADKTFVLVLKGNYGSQELNFPTKGTFIYEHPYLVLTDQSGKNGKCQINDQKNELKIVEHPLPMVIDVVLKKKAK
ncbi:hypothetical protein [Capnocytophaga sp.]|uniref:hypothetical protein n=1 Tax=Capnocytophaga sp. TaxID=44737 RepID=UPI0026DD18BA|nr:hypothetical protein [Capnocytophaga sp.]MDO5104318.1 hypothetical protein [Capnocytophaga sp.]